jgi:hypothetical protein
VKCPVVELNLDGKKELDERVRVPFVIPIFGVVE